MLLVFKLVSKIYPIILLESGSPIFLFFWLVTFLSLSPFGDFGMGFGVRALEKGFWYVKVGFAPLDGVGVLGGPQVKNQVLTAMENSKGFPRSFYASKIFDTFT